MTGPTIGRRQLTRGMLAAAGGVLLAAALPGPALAQAVTYTVQPGDTLWSIAQAHGLDHWQPIYEANRGWLADPNLIHAGMVLVIPTAGEAAPPAADPAPAPAPAPPSGTAEVCGFARSWVTDTIIAAANAYGQSPCQMLEVAYCESRFNPNAYHRGSGAAGLFQFLGGTWRSTPYRDYSVFNAWANAQAAAWMWSVGRRNEWVCRIGLVQA
jgi:hypothetical protein